MKKLISFLLIFMLAFTFVGCGEDDVIEDVVPTSISIKGNQAIVEVGAELKLTAEITPKDAVDKLVTWTSSDSAIATIDQSGNFKAISEGTVTITVASKNYANVKKSVSIVVEKAEEEILPTEVEIFGAKNIKVGANCLLSALVTPSEATNKEIVWTSSDETIATVDGLGTVTAVAEGQVTITATAKASETVVDSVNLKVLSADASEVQVLVIVVNGASRMEPADTQEVYASITPGTADDKTVTWTSSDETIATVDEFGTVTALKEGTVKITATANDGSDVFGELEIEVLTLIAPTALELTGIVPPNGVKFGVSVQLTVNATPNNGNPAATFTSSDEALATVDEKGVVKTIAPGTVTITATSTVDPTISDTFDILINDGVEVTAPQSITIVGESEIFVGKRYSYVASVVPATASQNVSWIIVTGEEATIDEDGILIAKKEGTVRIRAISTEGPEDKRVKSTIFTINVSAVPEPEPPVNLQGYEIIIMNADSALTDNDPFLNAVTDETGKVISKGYTGADKLYKQQAWNDVQTNYNCKIKVVKYPDTAPWGAARIKWLIDNAGTGKSECDLGIVSSNWMNQFAEGTGNAAVDVTSLYNRYGLGQMDPTEKECGSYKGKLYTASTGISATATYIDLGLYYNLAWVERLGVEDPAQLFMDDKWTYSKFEEWVMAVQAQLTPDVEHAIGGSPYYYWLGMTNAAGVKVADSAAVTVEISSSKSKEASALISKLYQAGCVEKVQTWAETDGEFFEGKCVMTTGWLWFVRADNRWNSTLWGDDTRFGYVPFPYPDNMSNVDTRISRSGLSVYMYVAGRNYPTGVKFDGIYRAVNDMFLNTIALQESDSSFDAKAIIRAALKKRIDNPASIDAIMFYTAKRTFFDPAHAIYGSISATPLKTPANNVMYGGKDYDEEFDAVYTQYYADICAIYA